MAGFKIPVFEKGSVLTHEMLDALKEYSMNINTLSYTGYSDGILCGCEVTMSGNMIMLAKGIVVYQKQLYLLPDAMKIMVHSGNDWQVLRLCIGNMSKDKNFITAELRLEITADRSEQLNKIEICRFRLQDGAKLRNKYRNFQDMATEFDTLNEIYAKWSAYERSSISIRILKKFAKEAMTKRLQNQQDIMFVQQILALENRTLNRDVILFYLNSRLKKNNYEMTNYDIYKGLQQILRMCQSDLENSDQQIERNERRIIVD